MGWTYSHREKGMTTEEYMQREYSSIKILESRMKNGVLYAAACNPQVDPEEVFALVILTDWASGYYNFGYKDMDETCGPCEDDCPAKILDMLTPTEHEFALAWRERCRAKIAKLASKPKVKPGDKVKFAETIEFRSGAVLDTFKFLKGNTFTSDGGYVHYNLGSDWKQREFEILT